LNIILFGWEQNDENFFKEQFGMAFNYRGYHRHISRTYCPGRQQ
jgi:hypothetical protein